MSKRTIAAVCATLGLGLVFTMTAANAATAKPTSVHGLTQRIETTRTVAVPHNTSELQASCHADEILTGGGYQLGSIGFNDKIYLNGPMNNRTWLVELYNDTDYSIDLWAFAICIGG